MTQNVIFKSEDADESDRVALRNITKAVVLGGTSAIGSEIIRKLRSDGAELLFTFFKNHQEASRISQSPGSPIRGVRVDLSSVESVTEFLSELRAFGATDLLVNSAGITNDGLCMDLLGNTLLATAMVNYVSPALISSQVGRVMASRRSGCIVQITSAAARLPKVGNSSYGASKIALERFTATLALELARFNVRTLCIAPAFVDTPMFDAFAGADRLELIRKIPMRQLLKPNQVAEVVLQFARGSIATTGNTIVLGHGELVFA